MLGRLYWRSVSMAHPDASSILTSIARLVAEAPTLREVVSKVAVTFCPAIPFERLHVLRLDRAESFVLFTARNTGDIESESHRIGDPSPDASDVYRDAHSRILCTIRQGTRVHGALWLTSSLEHAFTDEHQALADSAVDLLGLAFEHNANVERDTLRRERIDSLRALLHTMAEALDIRIVFAEISDVVRAGLPHDVLVLTSWSDDQRSIRAHAVAGVAIDDPTYWEPIPLPDSERSLLHRDPYVVRDVETDIPPQSVRGRLFRRFGLRSALRVPTALGNAVFGSLFFLSREPEAFGEDDIDFAHRVADHVALALSHERLAEVARRDAESRETAARLEAQVASLTRELDARGDPRRVVGHSKRWRDILTQATRVAGTETTVLLTGESGTGKEVVARFIHHASRRRGGPFVAINCAALPDQLLESELFGHERGAFTGATNAKPGRIEQATGGVLFLDEVGEMALAVQAKLLRVLEEREFMRLGGTRLMKADVRLIAATNRDLPAAMKRGEFREDLYYRIGVFEISLPPLRERRDDILELAEVFLRDVGHTVGRPAAGLAPDARAQLLSYHWPGNVRELRNAIERAVILVDGGDIHREHLPFASAQDPGDAHAVSTTRPTIPSGGVNLEAIERSLVVKALAQARFNKTRAAKLLGLTRGQLYSRIEKYGLSEPES